MNTNKNPTQAIDPAFLKWQQASSDAEKQLAIREYEKYEGKFRVELSFFAPPVCLIVDWENMYLLSVRGLGFNVCRYCAAPEELESRSHWYYRSVPGLSQPKPPRLRCIGFMHMELQLPTRWLVIQYDCTGRSGNIDLARPQRPIVYRTDIPLDPPYTSNRRSQSPPSNAVSEFRPANPEPPFSASYPQTQYQGPAVLARSIEPHVDEHRIDAIWIYGSTALLDTGSIIEGTFLQIYIPTPEQLSLALGRHGYLVYGKFGTH
ncbi:hypothetical protein B0H11DRAFT_1924180 [Mycena galericulata]|nr:hypothetical protein B0H11DRAFT_1924180 [Mycena galericulata]